MRRAALAAAAFALASAGFAAGAGRPHVILIFPDNIGAGELTSFGGVRSVPTPGSGWGDRIPIVHTPDRLDLERVIFSPRDLQPTARYRIALDGSKTEHDHEMGRAGNRATTTAAWDGDRLVVTSLFPVTDPRSDET